MPPSNVNHMYQRTRYGGVYKNPDIAKWELACRPAMKKQKKQEKDSYSVSMSFYHDNKRKNDIDSKLKIVLDMLQREGVYPDDCLVTDLVVAKRYDKANPRLELEVI